jgi:hypothetical protein
MEKVPVEKMENIYVEAVNPNGHEVVDGASAVQEPAGRAIPVVQHIRGLERFYRT